MEFQNEKEKFKKHLQNGDYKTCADIIENKIIDHIVKLIRQKEKDYEYTNILDLIDISEALLDEENKYIASKIKFFNTEEEDLNRLERLMTLYTIL